VSRLRGAWVRVIVGLAVKSFLSILIALVLAGNPGAPRACSICGCGDPLQSAGSVPPLPGGFRFTLQTDYLTATAASDEDPSRTESLTQRGASGTVMYGPAESLSLIGIIPFLGKDWTLSGGDEPAESAKPVGLGDINVGARYYFLQSADYHTMTSQFLALSAGTTIPTGSNDTQAGGERIDQHAQLGTGAWGPYVGLTYVLNGTLWTGSVNATATFHGTNDYDYRFGNSVRWGIEGQRRLGTQFAVSVAGEGRYAARDVSGGEDQVNTGGTVIDVTPGLWWSPAPDWGFYARAQIPVATDLFGEQTVGTTFQIGTQLLVQ